MKGNVTDAEADRRTEMKLSDRKMNLPESVKLHKFASKRLKSRSSKVRSRSRRRSAGSKPRRRKQRKKKLSLQLSEQSWTLQRNGNGSYSCN